MTKMKKRPSKATKAAAPKGKRAALPGSEDERNRKVWEANDRFLTSGIKIKDVTDRWNPQTDVRSD